MSQPPPRQGQVFAAPTVLRDRLGPRFGRIDPEAIAKAEAALKGLSSQFGQWLQDEVTKLEAAREAIRTEGATRATIDKLFTNAHDLKGLGATYEFPLITRIAGSLCKLLGDGDERVSTPMALVDAHVNTIRAAVRDNIRDSDNPIGQALASELEKRTADYLAART
ncbi:Hpt domain-containing protein [Caulobacter sp. S45]|uniref:Hpt domain-containing protein n=1 Tax=Caulobacter sp. S45 TaxID=1641861 RepID=UPI0015756A00|nr:Hpt domain-containing protein [Caulobacter sp. S45]